MEDGRSTPKMRADNPQDQVEVHKATTISALAQIAEVLLDVAGGQHHPFVFEFTHCLIALLKKNSRII